jgi:hypothetical protein
MPGYGQRGIAWRQAMESVLGSREKISSRAGQIKEIIFVIDGISFQTNIVALNAAVKATRAGEHGKGFAVIAAEAPAVANPSVYEYKGRQYVAFVAGGNTILKDQVGDPVVVYALPE